MKKMQQWIVFFVFIFATSVMAGQAGTQKWMLSASGGYESTPAIGKDGTIFIACGSNLTAINSNGTQRWVFTVSCYNGNSPAIGSDGTVYIGSSDMNLYAITSSGTQQWTYKTYGAIAGSPAIAADGTLYVASGGSDKNLYAINPDGSKKWSVLLTGTPLGSPAIATDGTIYIASNGQLNAFNSDGTQKWIYPNSHISYNYSDADSPVIGADGTVYIAAGYLYAINSNGTLKWSFTSSQMISSPTIGADGTVYAGSGDDYLYAFSPAGSQLWSFRTWGSIFSSPAIASDGTVYITSGDGSLYAINPATQASIWSFPLSGNSIGYCSPAIGTDGTIYFTNGVSVYAIYGTAPLAYSAWPMNGHDLLHTHREFLLPTITNVSPVFGSTSGGTPVTLTGTEFNSGCTVAFGGAAATGVTIVSATQITCTTPAHAAGVVDVTVTNLDGEVGTASGAFTYESPAATPTFSPAAGTYSNFQTVTITCATNNSTIYYTTNGTTPTTSSTQYTAPLSVSGNETIQAIAAASGMVNSAMGSAAYVFQAATPVLSLAAGIYDTAQSVTITCATNNSTIYYTTDGSTPNTTSSPTYTGPIQVSVNTTIKAVAAATNMANSAPASAAYGIRAATPVITPAGGTCLAPQSVTITSTTTGAAIYYTTDGSTPNSSSPQYSTPLTVASTTTLKAYTVMSGMTDSLVVSATYTFVPPSITSLTAQATEGAAFNFQLTASGSVPITYTVAAATPLPTGLSLSSGGAFSGIPTVCGETAVTLTATNTAGLDTELLILTIFGTGTPSAPTVDSLPTTPQPVAAGQSVTLSAAASNPGVDLLLYTWNFGDGTTGIGASVTHTYANAGVYTVTLTISNGVNSTTETVTVAINPASGTPDPTQFKMLKCGIKFNFTKKNSDNLLLSGTLPVAIGFMPSGKNFEIVIGGYTSNLTLNARGQCSNSTDSIKLSGKLSKNSGYSASPVKFAYSVKKRNLLAALQALGFSNGTFKGHAITVPVLMVLDVDSYMADYPAVYTAKENKTGSAK